ncbi:MAG TPA: replication-relaxation family protein [Chloroflexota bacterium]|nr:replication-relaxation family protein [Chloroflexota bacterium]
MDERLQRRDAWAALDQCTVADRRILHLLIRLPFLWAEAIAVLNGLAGLASVYRSLRRLEAVGLTLGLRVPLRPGASPRLYYPTDAGLAATSLDRGAAQSPPPRCARSAALLAAAPGLPQLVASYELLAALAGSRTGRPSVVVWERPWRRRYQPPTAKQPATVQLPARAVLSWGATATAYLLLPDLGGVPLQAYRATLGRLLVLRHLAAGELPPLVIGTTTMGRAEAWNWLLDDVSRARNEAPLARWITTWANLRVGPAAGDGGGRRWLTVQEPPVYQPSGGPLDRRERPRPAAPVAGAAPQACQARCLSYRLGQLALRLAPADYALLEVVGRHPFLTAGELSTVLGWTRERTSWRRNRLIKAGLVRLLEPGEAGGPAALGLTELTADGLALVTSRLGIPLEVAVRHLGLVAGGPDQPIGQRRSLLQNLDHTLGVNAVFVSLHRTAQALVRAGSDDAVLEWRSAAACSRGRVRPDGYGIYRHRGEVYGFFLEYDRGTMSGRDYRQKFTAYLDYRASGRYEQDYDGFPTILVVTTNPAAEERIARAVRASGIGWAVRLRVLLTCDWRINRDPANLRGLLGPIWREPHEENGDRCPWPPGRC